MTVELDHILVFCATGAPEDSALVARRFVEGLGQSHRGQGRRNRFCRFADAYLELLRVESAAEALSEGVSPDRALEVGFGGGGTLPSLLETAGFAAA